MQTYLLLPPWPTSACLWKWKAEDPTRAAAADARVHAAGVAEPAATAPATKMIDERHTVVRYLLHVQTQPDSLATAEIAAP